MMISATKVAIIRQTATINDNYSQKQQNKQQLSTQNKTKITNYRLFFDFSFYFILYITKYMYLCTRN